MAQDVAVATYTYKSVVPIGGKGYKKPVKLVASTSYPCGTLVGEVAASLGTYGPYADANSDGTGVAVCVIEKDCYTDASGNIFYGSQASSEWGQSFLTTPAWFRGEFNVADIVGLDAAGVTDLKARKIYNGSILLL